MKHFLCLFFLFACSYGVVAQYQMGLVPRISPDRSVSQTIGYVKVDITYGSPSANGRQLWGDLVPYNKVWRAGANDATTIEFSEEVKVNGEVLEAGKYALFVMPRDTASWLAIFSKKHDQWGSFSYDESEDALRVEVTHQLDGEYQERLEYRFKGGDVEKNVLTLLWGTLRLPLEIETSYMTRFVDLVEERVEAVNDNLKWVVYIQGAEHLVNKGEQLDKALSWLESAVSEKSKIKDWNKQFYPTSYIDGHLLWTTAKLYAAQNSYPKAVGYYERMTEIGNQSYYERNSEKEDIDALVASWRTKK